MSRPKGSKNKVKATTVTTASNGLIDLGGGVPVTPKVTVLPTVEPAAKKTALGRVSREKIFRAAIGQLSVHESKNGNVNLKGRMTDENGITYMTTMFMPLNPTTGKAIKVSEIDLNSFIG